MNKADWIEQAANELASHFSFGSGRDSYVTDEQRQNVANSYAAIIAKYVPKGVSFMTGDFKPGVAYMPVPQCGSCLHWDNVGEANKYHGKCLLPDHDPFSLAVFTAMYTNANFGCIAWKAKT